MKSITILLLLLLLFPFVTPIPSPATFHDVKKRFKLKQIKLRKKKQFTNQPTIQQPNNFQQIQTTIKYVGHDRTPVIILDDLLPHNHYLALRNSLRKRTDFYEGHGNKVNFPGKIASLDRLTVDPLIDALLSSKLLAEHFPPAMFDKQHIGAFASILCNPWGITTGVHHDFANSQHENIKAPAAVFYFGFDGATSNAGIQTGTAFFREKISGLERATSIAGNQTKFCNKYPLSIVCPKTRALKQKKDIELYDETDRVVSQPNRLVLYPQDLLHKAWVETKNANNDNDSILPCSPNEGRLAISLFFLMPKSEQLIDDLRNKWKNTATKTLSGEVEDSIIQNQKQHQRRQQHKHNSLPNGGFNLPLHTHKNECEIDAIDFNQLTVESFMNNYFGIKPVLIRNGVADWIAQTKWTKPFIKKAGLDTATPTLETFLNRLSDNFEAHVVPRHYLEPDVKKRKQDERNVIERLLNERAHTLAGVNTNHTNYLFRRLHHGQLSYNAKSMDEDIIHAAQSKNIDNGAADTNFATFNVMQDINIPKYFYRAFNSRLNLLVFPNTIAIEHVH